MRPPAGAGKLKHAPPIQANDLPVVGQALSPVNSIFPQLLTLGALIGARRVALQEHNTQVSPYQPTTLRLHLYGAV